MNRIFNACISILLVIILVFSVAITPIAASNEKCDCGEEPIVYVAALGSAVLYKDADTENETVVFRPEAATYLKLVAKLILPIVSLIVTKDYEAFSDSAIPAIYEVFGALANDAEGNSTPDITTKTTLPTDPAHGLDYSYYFGYDFRADPLTLADDLDKYIDRVLEITGHDKVRLRASSMGGVVTMAYLYKHGYDKIKSIILQCSPIQGTAVAGDLFCGKIEINDLAVYRYAKRALPSLLDGFAETLVGILVDVLYNSGLLNKAVGIVNKLVENCRDRIYSDILIPVFKSNCGIWGFVPDENYEQAKEFMLGDNPNPVLEARIDEYHYNVQCRAGEILNTALNDGVPIMILAGTNMQRTPLVPSWKNDSDGTVDTKYATVGATVAELDGTLGDGYTQAINDGHNHISPDNKLDASTCALPDNTWFVNDMLHSTTHDGHDELYCWFYENDDEGVNVFSNTDYPQFLQNNVKEQTLIPQK